MSPKDVDGIANSEDPDQTAPLGAVWSGSALFAQTYLSENLGSLRYVPTSHQLQNDIRVMSWENHECVKKKVTAQLISTFVSPTEKVQPLFFLNLKFKPLAIFYVCIAQYVSDLLRNPKDMTCYLMTGLIYKIDMNPTHHKWTHRLDCLRDMWVVSEFLRYTTLTCLG